jgi:hypothetical protein
MLGDPEVFTIRSLADPNAPPAATANPATSATHQANGGGSATATTATDVAKVAAVAVATGGLPQLSPVEEAARQEVLRRLEIHPDVMRAFVCRFERDVLIVSLAVRGIGTCELSIPRDRFNQNSVAQLGALLRCLEAST